MNSRDGEKVVLRAIESQLRTEDPQLVACFLAFNSVTPGDEPQEGRQRMEPAGMDPASRAHRGTNTSWYRIVVRIAVLLSMLIAVIAGTMVWLLAAISQ